MSNASIRVQDLINQFAVALGNSAAIDLFYYWLEEEYRHIREQPWSWNWTQDKSLTPAEISEPDGPLAFFGWSEGSETASCGIALFLNPDIVTGRKVYIGDEWYRVIEYGLVTAPSRLVRFDRPLKGVGSEVKFVFVRDERSVRATKIKNILLNGIKLPRVSEDYLLANFHARTAHHPGSTGLPRLYVDQDHIEIPAPMFPPKVTAGAGDVLANGKYVYFYTRYDPERNLESAPGPALEWENTNGFAPTVQYSNPTTIDESDYTTYMFRLYRSQINPSRDRPPMFRLQERTAFAPVSAFLDTYTGTLYDKPAYYDGSYSTIRLWPPPDKDRNTLVIDHLNCWGGRMYEQEYLNLGRDNQVLELLRIFLAGVMKLASRDANEQRVQSAVFRSQLAYLLTKSRNAAEGDSGIENYDPLIPGPMAGDDWVEALPWKDW